MDSMNGDSFGDAVARLQEGRNNVAKSMRLVFIGVPCLLIPPLGIALILIGATKVSKAKNVLKGLYKDAFVRDFLIKGVCNLCSFGLMNIASIIVGYLKAHNRTLHDIAAYTITIDVHEPEEEEPRVEFE